MTESQTDPRAAGEPGRPDGRPAEEAGPGQPQPEQQPARTLWRPLRKTPLRQFLQTETGSAAILTGAVLAALVWANVSNTTYQQVWGTELAARVGHHGMSMDLRTFVNSGLMT